MRYKKVHNEALKKVYENYGAAAEFNLTGHLPYLRGLAHYEVLENCGPKYLLLPQMQVNQKHPMRFLNKKSLPTEIMKKYVSGLPWQTRSFIKGMQPISKEMLNGPAYYYENGLRRVEPYFDCLTNVVSKVRYPFPDNNMALADYFTIRFSVFTREFFEIMIKNNQIVVNTDSVDPEYIVQENDVVSHLFHKHESDVLDLKVEKIFESEEMLVVDKPSSWPVYPIGNYKYNTLQYIMLREYGYNDLRTVHRIDAPTSGICILAKQNGVSAKLQNYFKDRTARKQYLALVDGKFTESDIVCEEPLSYYKISPVKLVKDVGSKEAKTIFKMMSYDEATDTSLLLCIPVTGRTHQIRLHLAHLGFYIVNDVLYNPRDFEEERTDVDEAEVQRTLAMMKEKPTVPIFSNSSKIFKHQYCLKCQSPNLLPNPAPSTMCLHSYRYSLGDDFFFESKLPSWAHNPISVLQNRKIKND